MSTSRKTKAISNDENLSPIMKKRSKTLANWIVKKPEEQEDILNEMGINVLESDESTSSGSTIVLAYSASDENSNEATPNTNLGGSKFCHPSNNNNRLNESIESDTTEYNCSFVDPNATLKPQTYSNNNNNLKFTRSCEKKYHKKKTSLVNEHLSQKPRSPLSSMLVNTNLTNIGQRKISSLNTMPSTSLDILAKTDISYEIDNGYSMHKTRPSFGKRDFFKQLSDEVILQIFKWLPKKTLQRCSLVCHRFNQLAQDESLWTRLDLAGKYLRAEALDQVLSRGVVILRLAQAELVHPVLNPEKLILYPDFESKLRYLDLSMTSISKPSLKQLLSRCYQLRKLSLEHVQINDEICDEIAKNVNLEALNLSMCEGLEAWTVRKLMIELTKLNSLNISWTLLNVFAVSALVTNVTPNLMRLNIAGCRKTMFDSHVETLATRCTQLLELDLSDCTGLTSDVISIVCKFKVLEYLSLSRCYGISASSYMELSKLPSLAFLDVFGILSENAIQLLATTFPSLGINKFFHSSVARPTVGTRRTSIWGLRTRD